MDVVQSTSSLFFHNSLVAGPFVLGSAFNMKEAKLPSDVGYLPGELSS